MKKYYFINVIFIAFLLLIKSNSSAAIIKDNSRFHIITNPINANQKILDSNYEVLLTSKASVNSYHGTKAQDIGIVYDEKDWEEKYLFKNYIRNNYVDLNYLRAEETIYVDELADYEIYKEWQNHDGGDYRYANKIIFYDLTGENIIREFEDLGFKKFYNGKFYYEEKPNDPQFYIWDSKTNEIENVGKYAICKMIDEDKLIVFEVMGRKTHDENEIFNDKVLFYDSSNNKKVEFLGYNFSDIIEVGGEKYYKIYYIKEVFKKSEKSSYEIQKVYNRFFNLVDEKLNKVLKNDINEIQFVRDNKFDENTINYKKIIEENKRNDPKDNTVLENIGISPANIIKIYEFEDGLVYLVKNKKKFSLYNQDGKQIGKTHEDIIHAGYLDKSLYNSLFLTPDENSLRNYFYISDDNKEIQVEYNRNTMLYNGNYGYYALTNIDVTDSELNYIDENVDSPEYMFNICNLKNKNINFTVNSKQRGISVYRLDENDLNYDLVLIDEKLYNIKGEEKKDKVVYCNVLEDKLYVRENLKETEVFVYDKYLKLIDTISNIQLELMEREFDKRYNVPYENQPRYVPLNKYDRLENSIFVDESVYWRVSGYIPNQYSIEYDTESIKKGYSLKSYKLNSYRFYDLLKGDKTIVSFCKNLLDFNEKYFTYQKSYEYGLMDYSGKVLVKFNIFDDPEEEVTHGWQLSTPY